MTGVQTCALPIWFVSRRDVEAYVPDPGGRPRKKKAPAKKKSGSRKKVEAKKKTD